MTAKPHEAPGADPRLLALAEASGAMITGKPDGSEGVAVVFTIDAWRKFDATLSLGAHSADPVLKPCPFCGGDAEFERLGTGRQSCIVACGNCGARHESSDEYERSGSSWNQRAAPEGPAPEPDCWAILTPNGSMLVSPDEAKGRKGAYPLYRAPEAPPPVEARQPHNPWRASIENILTGDNYFRAAEWHELLADLDRLYAMPPAVKPLDDPRLQQAFGDAIEGALAFGYQQNNKPPVGHWLNRFWNIGSAEAEKASKPPIVTDEMVTAYLKANDEYWRKVDEIAPPIGVWRNGTPREATRESLRAALAAPAGAIQPNRCKLSECIDMPRCKTCLAMDRAYPVAPPITPLPLDSAGGAPSAPMTFSEYAEVNQGRSGPPHPQFKDES